MPKRTLLLIVAGLLLLSILSACGSNGSVGPLFVSADGIYALRADSGNMMWHQSLNADPSTDFTPVTAVNGVVYMERTDGGGNSILYALNASTGAEYWHMGQIRQATPLTVLDSVFIFT